jgi:hypothetical protein
MEPLRTAFGTVLRRRPAVGPAKRLRLGIGSYRASDVMPEPKPVPRQPRVAATPDGLRAIAPRAT